MIMIMYCLCLSTNRHISTFSSSSSQEQEQKYDRLLEQFRKANLPFDSMNDELWDSELEEFENTSTHLIDDREEEVNDQQEVNDREEVNDQQESGNELVNDPESFVKSTSFERESFQWDGSVGEPRRSISEDEGGQLLV